MRYDHVIQFYNEGKKHYDFKTSKVDGEPELLLEVMGNVTDMGVDRSNELFGSLNQGSKVIRLVEPVDLQWSYLTIDGSSKKYRLTTATKPSKNFTLIVGEDVG